MRIQFQMEGGVAFFPGLAAPVVVEVDKLPPEQASEWERLVAGAQFFDLPATVGDAGRPIPDGCQYTITVEEGGRSSTVCALDPVVDAGLAELIGRLRAWQRLQRTRPRGG
jgi:hypothetical protein